jgi:cytochrome b pre-mRNA-processing protein 3
MVTGFSIGWLARRQARKVAVGQAYDGLMKAALAPDFYLAGDVADTFEGRAQMVTLHASLAIRRINTIAGAESAKIAAALNTRVLDGFDAAYREQGVGDSSIARKVRKLAEAHYGLGTVVSTALDDADRESAVIDVIERNGVTQKGKALGLATYLIRLADRLKRQPDSEILAGKPAWQDLSKTP